MRIKTLLTTLMGAAVMFNRHSVGVGVPQTVSPPILEPSPFDMKNGDGTVPCLDEKHAFPLPDPVPDGYHFFCSNSENSTAEKGIREIAFSNQTKRLLMAYAGLKGILETARNNATVLVLWNHAVWVKGFVIELGNFTWKGIHLTNTTRIEQVYFTARPDPHGVPPYICFFPSTLKCQEGTGNPSENRTEQEGPYGAMTPPSP